MATIFSFKQRPLYEIEGKINNFFLLLNKVTFLAVAIHYVWQDSEKPQAYFAWLMSVYKIYIFCEY